MTGQPVQTTSSVGTEQGSKSEGVQDPYLHGTLSEQKWNPDLNVPMN